MIPVHYKMKNEINGTAFRIEGAGEIVEGIQSIHADISGTPRDWCGTLLPCICSGPGPVEPEESRLASTKCLLAFAPNGYATEEGTLRRATLWASTGDVLAKVTATGDYRMKAGELTYDINVQTETVAGSIASRLVNVDHYGFVIFPNGPGRAKVVSQYRLSTEDGQSAQGATYISYRFIDSNAEIPEVIIGRNLIKVQQIGRRIQWMVRQSNVFGSDLGTKTSTVRPL